MDHWPAQGKARASDRYPTTVTEAYFEARKSEICSTGSCRRGEHTAWKFPFGAICGDPREFDVHLIVLPRNMPRHLVFSFHSKAVFYTDARYEQGLTICDLRFAVDSGLFLQQDFVHVRFCFKSHNDISSDGSGRTKIVFFLHLVCRAQVIA